MSESNNKGWIALHRSVTDHWIFEESRKFSRFEAWVDLLIMVNHTENKTMIDGKLVTVKRGQRITSLRKLGERWKWSLTKVDAFLKLLEEDEMIVLKKDTKKTLITVVNYDFYQNNETKKRHRKDEEKTDEEHRKDEEKTQKKTNNNDLTMSDNENNDKEVVENMAKPYKEIIEYLNQKSNKNFKSNSKATQRLIDARLNEGYKVDDFKKVIDIKISQWFRDERMNQYLRPQTLFSPKFESYLNETPNYSYQSTFGQSSFIPPDEENLPF